MTPRRGAMLPGLLLIALGAYLLALNLGVALPGLDRLWPALPLVFGLAWLVQFFAEGRRHDGLVFTGVAGTLVGAFFFAFTLGPLEWAQMGRFWPVFVLIGSASFFAQWLARPRQGGLLVASGLALVIGGAFLLANARVLSPALTEQLLKLWPILLIIAGLSMLGGYVARRSARREP